MMMGGVTLASGVVTRSSTNAWTLELDGHPFIPFGLNRFTVMTPGNNRDDWTTEQYLQQAAAHGVNTLRVFVPEPDFESVLGTYDAEQLRRLDQTVQLAEQYGMKLIVCLFDHWVFRNALATSAYSVHKGGPLESGRAFYTHPVARVHQAQRIRFIVTRYKTSSDILAWEPINELNGVAADYPGQQTDAMAWLHFAAAEIRAVDPTHLITESLTGDVRWEDLWRDSVIDLVQLHTYREVRSPERAAAGARNTLRWAQETFQKPVMIGEYAPLGTLEPIVRADFVTATLLASFTSGGSSLLWTHRNDEFGDITDAEWDAYARLAFLPKLLSQPGPQGPVPAESGAAYQYGPVVAVSALGGPLRVTLPFEHFTIRAYHPDRHDWSMLPDAALDVQPGTFLLFERTP